MKIPDEILTILSKCTVEDNILFLPPGQLERETYLAVNKCLANIGGKWNRKAKGHVFDHDPSDDLDSMLLTGETVDMKKVYAGAAEPSAEVIAKFDPQLLIDAADAVGGSPLFFLGYGPSNAHFPSLLVMPPDWAECNCAEPIALVLPLRW